MFNRPGLTRAPRSTGVTLNGPCGDQLSGIDIPTGLHSVRSDNGWVDRNTDVRVKTADHMTMYVC